VSLPIHQLDNTIRPVNTQQKTRRALLKLTSYFNW
jgi:hypothetical protein